MNEATIKRTLRAALRANPAVAESPTLRDALVAREAVRALLEQALPSYEVGQRLVQQFLDIAEEMNKPSHIV